jgi:hypothetical protein
VVDGPFEDKVGLRHYLLMGQTTAPTWLILLAPVAAIAAAMIASWTARLGWSAEQRREHIRWAREQRATAYLAFLDICNDTLWAARSSQQADVSWRPDVEWLEPLDKALLRVQLFGSQPVAAQAKLAINAFADGLAVATSSSKQKNDSDHSVLHTLVELVRKDLQVNTDSGG